MLLTPGPTAVPESVREAMAREQPNPDVEPAFRETYAETCERLRRVHGGGDDVVVLGGEGILGLEAAVASLVGPGDSVLCVSNGLYGDGFAEFVTDYGGEATLVSADDDGPLDVDAVAAELAAGDYDLATMVHCETPTGTLNDLDPVLDLLEEYGVLSVVDAVSSLGGVDVPAERIDVCLGASQKCFSAPPGLATAAVSDAAWERMDERETRGVYADLRPWRDVSEGFPYTHLAANVAALHRALGLLLSEGLESAYARHERAAQRCRKRAAELGVDCYPDPERSSPTVTALSVPGRAGELQATLAADHDVVLATGLAEHAEDVLRVGHMGYGADVERVDRAMDALAAEL